MTRPDERQARWYQWHMLAAARQGHPLAPVDELPVSEILPGLYRAVLDAVATLEARQRRPDAAAIRLEATRVYSRAWTPDAAKRLRNLRSRADRILGTPGRIRYDLPAEALGRGSDLERTTA